MTFQEVLADDRSQIERRRETYEAFRNFNAPGEIGAGYRTGGEGSFGLSVGKEFDAVAVGGELDAVAVGSGLNELVGIAASRGVVQGVARVARTPQEAARVERGAILVCPFTDPGWTPVLARVGGVVTETGGLLSHAAVICREFGIPAVLGVPAATSRIPDGASITVDANTGRVHLMNTRRNGADR
jgi:pyruvate,water dikinase